MNYIKKIVLFFGLLGTSTFLQAEQSPARLISPWGEGSIAFPFLQEFYKYDESRFLNRVDVLGSCVEATNIIKNTDKPVISIAETLYLSENHPCYLMHEEYFITTIGMAGLYFCTNIPNDEIALEKFKGDIRVGHFNGEMFRIPINKILDNMSGSNSRTVPYRSTPDAIAAMKAGEVDFIVTAQNNMAKNCFLTTGDTSDTVTYSVSDFYDGDFSDAFFTLAIVGNNIDKEKIKEEFIKFTDPAINDIYVNGRGKHYDPNFMKKSTDYQLEFIKKYVDKLNKFK